MNKPLVDKQFHTKWSGYSLISYSRDTYKPRKCRQAGLSVFPVNTRFKQAFIN